MTTSPTDPASFADALQEMRHQFAAALPDRIETLQAQYRALDLADWRVADAQTLHQQLHALSGRMPPQPYRVLLVDDDPLLLQTQAAVLRAAGMEVHTLTQPRETLAVLDAFRPDVLVLDVYMPEVSGPELAAIVREREDYLHLPILFLSAETDPSQQLLALNLGGDDFLVKPVQADHLVQAVTVRARRARQHTAWGVGLGHPQRHAEALGQLRRHARLCQGRDSRDHRCLGSERASGGHAGRQGGARRLSRRSP
jgi:PleD family two-component response regulator